MCSSGMGLMCMHKGAKTRRTGIPLQPTPHSRTILRESRIASAGPSKPRFRIKQQISHATPPTTALILPYTLAKTNPFSAIHCLTKTHANPIPATSSNIINRFDRYRVTYNVERNNKTS